MANSKIEIDYDNINFNDQKTFELIGSGNTIGVFQLESNTGRKWAKDCKPNNLDEISQLIALIRPGVLQAKMEDGKSLAEHYVLRKHGKEQVDYIHDSLKPILKNTYGILLFQEQAIKIGQDIAGMSLSDSDNYIRYAIGKKLIKMIEAGKKMFISGCMKNGISEDIAGQIFSWIQAGQRYSFNACLSLDTLVYHREDGYKKISDIKIGDYILAPSPKNTEIANYPNTYVKVKNIYHNGKKHVYDFNLINTDNRKEVKTIRCTENHKILLSNQKLDKANELLYNNGKIIDKNFDQYELLFIEGFSIEETIDLEVDSEQHVFYANDIPVSNSHSCSFAQHTYLSAYLKAHYPQEFFTTYLKHAKHRLKPKEEIRRLIQNAREYKIRIKGPDLRYSKEEFSLINKSIFTGITDIKSIGSNHWKKLEAYKLNNKIPDTFYEYLLKMSDLFLSGNIALIKAGALDFYGLNRQQMIFIFEIWNDLTDLEKDKIRGQNFKDLGEALNFIATQVNKRRLIVIQGLITLYNKPVYEMSFNNEQIEKIEIDYIGAPLSRTRLSDSNLTALANITCASFNKGGMIKNKTYIMAGIITEFKEIKTKKGDMMGFLSIEDNTGATDGIVCFPEQYKDLKHNMVEDLVVLITGKRDWKTKNLIIEDIIEI